MNFIYVVDAATKRRHIHANGILRPDDGAPGGSLGIGPTTDLALLPTATVAWIARDDFGPAPPRYQVWQAGLARSLCCWTKATK